MNRCYCSKLLSISQIMKCWTPRLKTKTKVMYLHTKKRTKKVKKKKIVLKEIIAFQRRIAKKKNVVWRSFAFEDIKAIRYN